LLIAFELLDHDQVVNDGSSIECRNRETQLQANVDADFPMGEDPHQFDEVKLFFSGSRP
jgi:hypothetical protein